MASDGMTITKKVKVQVWLYWYQSKILHAIASPGMLGLNYRTGRSRHYYPFPSTKGIKPLLPHRSVAFPGSAMGDKALSPALGFG
jgi:hypothetical protein